MSARARDPGPGDGDRALERRVFLAAAALGAAVVLAYGPWQVPLLEDNQHYFFMAERVADGVPPHVSNFDPKNTLSVLLSGAGIRAGRWLGISDVAASRIVSAGALAAGLGLLALFAYRLLGSVAAAGITALVPGALHYLPLMTASGNRPKVFLLFFMAASLFLLTRERWRASSVAAALGFLTWQPALLLVGSVLATHWIVRRDLRELAGVAAVAVVPVAAYEAWFAWRGALDAQITQAYLFPARHMTSQFEGLAQSLSDLSRYWGWGYSVDALGVDLTWVLPGVFVVALAVAAVSLGRRVAASEASIWPRIRRRPALVHFGLSMVGTFAFTLYDANGPPDFFFVFPFAAVVVGAAVAAAVRRVERAGSPRAGRVLAAGVAGLLLFVTAAGAREAYLHPYDLDDQRRLGERVGTWLDGGGSVYAVGTTHLLAFNRAPNWMRYSLFFRGIPSYLEAESGRSRFVPRRGGELPDVILTSRYFPPGWPGWLREAGYRDVTDAAFEVQDIRVWRRAPGRETPGRRTDASDGDRLP